MSTKKYILELFETRRGQSISGSHIADKLSITRNAVWKAVKELEKDGYKIAASTKKGYCFCESNDILSAEGMLPFLTAKQAEIAVYPSLESTNTTAKQLAISGAKHGTIVIADHQTGGRGRYNRNFFSPSGHGIYMSFILRPTQPNWAAPLFTVYAAVSVCKAIETTTSKTPQIKWVNDIFLDGKKICGILTEAVTDFESGNMQWVVVGIGINFTTPSVGFPDDIRHTAGSIFSYEKPNITRNYIAAEISNRILSFDDGYDSEIMLDEYRKRLMMLGRRVIVTGPKEPFQAMAIDIDNEGRLIVKKDDGEFLSLATGEISIKEVK